MEVLVLPFIVSQRPWACFKVVNDERDEVSVSHDERLLYAFEAGTTQNCKESLNLVQRLSSNVNTALRVFRKDFVKEVCHAVLSSELYTMTAKVSGNEAQGSTDG